MSIEDKIAKFMSLVTPPEQLPPPERFIQQEAIDRKVEEMRQLDTWVVQTEDE